MSDTMMNNSNKKINLQLPNRVTSLKPFSDKYLISSNIDSTGLERSRPLVKGTIQ